MLDLVVEPLADLLTRRLLELGLSRYRLGKRLGINAGMITQVINGTRSLPVEQIEPWARELGWSSGTPEYDAFVESCQSNKAKATRRVRGHVEKIERRAEFLEDELRRVRELNERVISELAQSTEINGQLTVGIAELQARYSALRVEVDGRLAQSQGDVARLVAQLRERDEHIAALNAELDALRKPKVG